MPEESIIKEEDRFHEAEGLPFDSAVCPGCGCLCEDIDLTLGGEEVQQVFNVCSWGLSKFHRGHRFLREPKSAKLVFPSLKRESRRAIPVSFDEAYDKAVSLIRKARRVVFFGLCQMAYEAQEVVASLIQRLDALAFPSEGMLLTPFFKAMKTYPYVSATLEEVRQLASTVLFWGANPLHSCPRLVTRYAVFVAGVNAPDRHISRKVFYADPHENDTGSFAMRIDISSETEVERLEALVEVIEQESFAIPKELDALVRAMEASPFVTIFVGRGVAYHPESQRLMDGLFKLSEVIRRRRPCVLLPIVSDFNAMGFYYACKEKGLFEDEVSLIQGDLRDYQPREGDLLFCIGSDPFWFFSEEQRSTIAKYELPVASISSLQNQTTHASSLVIPVALSGVEAEGLAFRLDGVPVWLRKVLPTAQPTDHEVLKAIEGRLGEKIRG